MFCHLEIHWGALGRRNIFRSHPLVLVFFVYVLPRSDVELQNPAHMRLSRLQSLFRRTTAPSRSWFWEFFIVVTQHCAFGALDEIPVTNFRALKIGTDPVHGLIKGSQKKYFAAHHRIVMIR